jgi:hypothetical protein
MHLPKALRQLTFNSAIKDKVHHYNFNLCGTTTETTYKICCGKYFGPASGHDEIKGIIILLQLNKLLPSDTACLRSFSSGASYDLSAIQQKKMGGGEQNNMYSS